MMRSVAVMLDELLIARCAGVTVAGLRSACIRSVADVLLLQYLPVKATSLLLLLAGKPVSSVVRDAVTDAIRAGLPDDQVEAVALEVAQLTAVPRMHVQVDTIVRGSIDSRVEEAYELRDPATCSQLLGYHRDLMADCDGVLAALSVDVQAVRTGQQAARAVANAMDANKDPPDDSVAASHLAATAKRLWQRDPPDVVAAAQEMVRAYRLMAAAAAAVTDGRAGVPLLFGCGKMAAPKHPNPGKEAQCETQKLPYSSEDSLGTATSHHDRHSHC